MLLSPNFQTIVTLTLKPFKEIVKKKKAQQKNKTKQTKQQQQQKDQYWRRKCQPTPVSWEIPWTEQPGGL